MFLTVPVPSDDIFYVRCLSDVSCFSSTTFLLSLTASCSLFLLLGVNFLGFVEFVSCASIFLRGVDTLWFALLCE